MCLSSFFFFFSSRRRHTRWPRDWSSDVCSSDLSFAGLVPNVGLGPYCVAKYGVVALAEVLQRELKEEGIGVSVLCPMRVGTNIGTSERNRDRRYGGEQVSPRVPEQDAGNSDLAGRVLDVDDVAEKVV